MRYFMSNNSLNLIYFCVVFCGLCHTSPDWSMLSLLPTLYLSHSSLNRRSLLTLCSPFMISRKLCYGALPQKLFLTQHCKSTIFDKTWRNEKNLCTRFCVNIFSFLQGKYPRVRLHVVDVYLCQNLPCCSSEWLYFFALPPTVYESSSCLIYLPVLGVVSFCFVYMLFW